MCGFNHNVHEETEDERKARIHKEQLQAKKDKSKKPALAVA
jgi:hypothetical protein